MKKCHYTPASYELIIVWENGIIEERKCSNREDAYTKQILMLEKYKNKIKYCEPKKSI